MEKQTSKLGLEKFRVAKLTNTSMIIGGSEDQPDGDNGGTQTEKTVNGSSMPCKMKTDTE